MRQPHLVRISLRAFQKRILGGHHMYTPVRPARHGSDDSWNSCRPTACPRQGSRQHCGSGCGSRCRADPPRHVHRRRRSADADDADHVWQRWEEERGRVRGDGDPASASTSNSSGHFHCCTFRICMNGKKWNSNSLKKLDRFTFKGYLLDQVNELGSSLNWNKELKKKCDKVWGRRKCVWKDLTQSRKEEIKIWIIFDKVLQVWTYFV